MDMQFTLKLSSSLKEEGDLLKKPIFEAKISSVFSKIKSLKELVSIENHENCDLLIEQLEELIAFEN